MNKNSEIPISFTDSAANRIKDLILKAKNPNLNLRIYIIGGGCGGFQYGFILDDKLRDDDMQIVKNGVKLVIDPMSLQYLIGSSIDYCEELKGSHFTVKNPNAQTTCSCGSSFSI